MFVCTFRTWMCMSSEKILVKLIYRCIGGTISQGREKEDRKDKFVFLMKNQRSINCMFFWGKNILTHSSSCCLKFKGGRSKILVMSLGYRWICDYNIPKTTQRREENGKQFSSIRASNAVKFKHKINGAVLIHRHRFP